MSDALAKLVQSRRDRKRKRQEREMPADEKRALEKIQLEAEKAGAALTTGGKGGLPPSLVLGVMRRDKFTCKIHGDKGEAEHGGLQVHHKGHLENPDSEWLQRKGKSNEPNNLVTLCRKAHDEIHTKDRAKNEPEESA